MSIALFLKEPMSPVLKETNGGWKMKFFGMLLLVAGLLSGQETKIAPQQVRGTASPVITVLAWDTTGKFVPLRIGANIVIRQSGGFWYLDAATATTPAPATSHERFRFTATTGQTLFVITPAAPVKDLWVYRNGLLQSSPGDYTASADLKTITAILPATAGDLFQIFSIQ